ncbi:hypothetical protein I6G66_09955 [Delftia acidovorans]|uniref:Uncharacterized protein n=1 Tax=Delftia acidovorans TaxID=80866 RepID=A0A7T2S7D1_DELAC|nr:hypothetical protein [Delftia acidovorans]QPS10289.1 hypothetical protein I6G66_09955 [Delftia acidovorans]
MAAELQERGRIVLAVAVAAMTIHIAYGRGRPEWDGQPTPPAGSGQTGLEDEIARRLVTEKHYVVRDQAGTIEAPGGDRYSISPVPTRMLLIRTTFGYGEAVDEPIREMAVFMGTQVAASVPPGQYYVTPDKITNPGEVYTLERRSVVVRPANKRDLEEIILPF